MVEQAATTVTAETQRKVFRRCLPMQIRLHEILRVLGSTEGKDCLDIGLDNGVISHHLRQRGGKWCTVASSEQAAEGVRQQVDSEVHVLKDHALPFKKKVFDLVVVADVLERIDLVDDFVEECHRVLKPDGRLVVNVAYVKPWTIINPLRKVLGLTFERRGWVRPGYTDRELFHILKNGFDVHHVRTYTRVCVEFVDTIVAAILRRSPAMESAAAQKVLRVYTIADLFYRLASQVDMLLFLSRGFYVLASSKRRAWLPRKTPVLTDGRSISEAVLSRAAR